MSCSGRVRRVHRRYVATLSERRAIAARAETRKNATQKTGNVIIAVLYLGVSGLIPVYSRIWVYSWRTKIPEMPTGFRAQVFGLGRKAPWLDHLPKPYWRRHIAGTMHMPIPCRTPTYDTSWRNPVS